MSETLPLPEFNVEGGARRCVDGKSHGSGCDTGGGSGREGGQTAVQRGVRAHGAQGGGYLRAGRDRGEIAGLAPKKRGSKRAPPDLRDTQIVELERETRRWKARVEQAEALVDLQKKSRCS